MIGASGTGKSQRAVIIANEMDTSYIIDDGLFIRDDRIVAGQSAKAEDTKVAAVRTALFIEEDHASGVRRAIENEEPDRILILATSERMVERICQQLQLPSPGVYLPIEDVVPEGEIRAALDARRRYGRHVVPVPTLEIKKTFVGLVINPLRLLYGGGRLRRSLMIEKSLVRPPFTSMGRFFISDRVMMQIAEHSVAELPGIVALSPPVIVMHDGQVSISVTCRVHNEVLSSCFLNQVQKIIANDVVEMTSIEVSAVNVCVTEIETRQPEGDEVAKGRR